MKDDGFMKMIHTALPPEAELAIELRCREVMACEDTERLNEKLGQREISMNDIFDDLNTTAK